MKTLLVPLLIALSGVSGFAQKSHVKQSSTSSAKSIQFSTAKINANRIGYPISNSGFIGVDIQSNWDGIYLDDPKYWVGYEEGIVWAATYNGGTEYRVGGSTYRSGLQPGKILVSGNEPNNFHPVADTTGNGKYRVYKIRKNWQSLPDGAEKEQYQKDYNEWPVVDGAPVNNDGTPKFLGEETAFYVANDLNQTATTLLYGAVPMGIEMQSTVWASSDPDMDKTIYRTVKLINKSGKKIENFIIGLWTDPDVMDAGNDRIGFDHRNGIMYTFTDQASWYDEKNALGLNQSYVVSYELISPEKNAFSSAWTNPGLGGSDNNDPVFGNISGSEQMYKNLTGNKSNGSSYTDPESNYVTFQPFGGDAITNSGYTDERTMNPSDKRMMMSVKPNSFNAGESFTFTYALVVTEGKNPIKALYNLRTNPRNHKYAVLTNSLPWGTEAVYDQETSTVRFKIGDYSATGIKVYLKDSDNSDFIANGIQLYDDGTHGDLSAGDHLFAADLAITPELKNLHVDVSVTYPSKSVQVKNWITDFEIYKPLNNSQMVIVSDNINNNGMIENGENINYQIKLNSEADVELQKMKIVTGEYADQASTVNSTTSGQSLLSGFNSIPQNNFFSFSTKIDLDFNQNGVINSSLTAFSRFSNGSVLAFEIPVQIQEIGLSMNMILTKKINGDPNSGVFGARTYGKLTLNDDYRIKVNANPVFEYDSVVVGYSNYQIEVKRQSTNAVLANSTIFPDFYGYNQPIFDNILLTKGTASNTTQIKLKKSAGINLRGHGYGSFGFDEEGNSGGTGLELGYRFHGSSIKNFTNGLPLEVEIRFPENGGQFSYVYDRQGNPSGSGAFTGYSQQPFEVWDISDSNNPKQLNTLIMESYFSSSHDQIWAPTDKPNDREYLVILNSNYDGINPDQSGSNHIDYSLFKPVRSENGNMFDALFAFWMVKKDPNLPPYTTGDKITINAVPPVADGDEFTFNSVHLEKVTAVGDANGKTGSFALEQNFPNPFNPSTVINYYVPSAGTVNLIIYNMLGQAVWSAYVNHSVSGNYKIEWNGKDSDGKAAASGIYLYSLQMNNSKITKKMMLVK